MAILYENFESYPVGAHTITNWVNFFGLNVVVAGGMPPSSTRALSMGQNGFWNDIGTIPIPISSVSVWWWAEFSNGPGFMNLLQFRRHQTFAGGGYYSFCSLNVNADNTLIATAPGVTLCHTTAAVLDAGAHFFQVNASFADAAGFVQVTIDVAMDGQSVMSGTAVSTLPTNSFAGFGGGTAAIDNVYFEGPGNFSPQIFDEVTIDVLTAIGTYPNPGSPVLRTSQGVIEVNKAPTDALLLVSQGVIELILGAGTEPGARLIPQYIHRHSHHSN